MRKPHLFKSLINYIAKNYGKDPGKMLVHTGVAGWTLSSLAQVCAIMFNDKIPKKQKLFLIPQEIADAGVNIASFYLITQTFTSTTLKLVNSGKFLPKSVRTFLVNKGVADKIGKKGFDVLKSGLLGAEEIKSFESFRNGADVIGTTLGSVISCNIVTPIIRNAIAANRQKVLIAKLDKKDEEIKKGNDIKETPIFYTKPSVANFQNYAVHKALNSRGSMTV